MSTAVDSVTTVYTGRREKSTPFMEMLHKRRGRFLRNLPMGCLPMKKERDGDRPAPAAEKTRRKPGRGHSSRMMTLALSHSREATTCTTSSGSSWWETSEHLVPFASVNSAVHRV